MKTTFQMIGFSLGSASSVCHDTWLSAEDLKTVQEYALKDMLAAARYPQVTFRSTTITQSGTGQFQVQGMLTVRDITKPAAATVPLRPGSGERSVADGTSRIRLTDFGLKPPTAILGAIGANNDVSFRFVVAAMPNPVTARRGE